MEGTLEKPTLTDDEVFEVVKNRLKTGKFEVVNHNLEMLGEWVGLCGDHAILNVTVKLEEGSGPNETVYTFFVKLYPRVEFVVEFIEGTGSFGKEIFVYKLFDLMEEAKIETLSECVPKCYLTVSNKFLVMENLMTDGYSTMSKHEVFDYDTTKVVLEAMAKLHASSLIYEEKNACRLIDNYEEDFKETYYNDDENFPNKQGLDAAFKGVLNLIQLFNFPEKLLSGKNFRNVLEEVCLKVYRLVKPSKKFRNVLCHGDAWATNLLVKRDVTGKPVRCKLVDFQCGRYAPPAQDVLSLIYLTTSREFRKRHMYNLIGIYYNCLEKHVTLAGFDMKKIVPFDEFLESCEVQKGFSLVQAATYFPLILLSSGLVKEYFGNKDDNKEALLVDRSVLVRENMDGDEDYKNRIRDSIQDLKDYCDYL